MPVTLKRTTSDDPDFANLVKQLDAVLGVVNGDSDEYYRQFNRSDTLSQVVVLYDEDEPSAIGAIRELEPGIIEVKRMFTLAEKRGRALGYQVLQELEKWSKELGYSEARLETHVELKPAIALYVKAGYHVIPNYSQYCGVTTSVCMAKALLS